MSILVIILHYFFYIITVTYIFENPYGLNVLYDCNNCLLGKFSSIFLFFSNATDILKTDVCLWKLCLQMFSTRPDMNEIANEQNNYDEGAYLGLNVVTLH